MGKLTIDLPAEQLLVVTTDENTTLSLIRLGDGAGGSRASSPIQFQYIEMMQDTEVAVGPFSTSRRYIIDSPSVGGYQYRFENKANGLNQLGTGIYRGGFLSVNAEDNTKFDISAGTGVIVDNYNDPENPVLVRTSWNDITGISPEFLATSSTSYVMIGVGGEVVQRDAIPDSADRLDFISVGVVVHTSRTIVEQVGTYSVTGYGQPHNLIDLADSVGPINKSGNVISNSGTDLKIAKTEGQSFALGSNWDNSNKVTNIVTSSALDGATMFFSYRDGSGGWGTPTVGNAIVPSSYDDGSGTLGTVPSNRWTIQRIFLAPGSDSLIVVYGQNLYNNKANAEAAIIGEEVEINPELDGALFRCYLLVRGNTTDLSDNVQENRRAKFIEANKFGSGPSTGTSTSTTDLQHAYDNSDEPEIMTNSTNGAICIKDGTGVSTNAILELLDNSDNVVMSVDGEGTVTGGAFATGVTGSRPSSPKDGQFFFDTTLGKPIWYDGSDWVDAAGVKV